MMKKLLLTAMAIATTIGAIAQVEPPVGAIDGRFSVATDKQVYFSQGNLQCNNPNNAATRTWAFAEHQYDRIGTANLQNTKVGVLFGSTIDLFGWSANNTTAPFGISLSQDAADYAGDFVDWGTNAITNGGNQPNLWRTLSQAEWIYLFSGRPNANSLYSWATVNNINGIVVLPDAFVCPSTVTFTPKSTNTYTITELENTHNGCEFDGGCTLLHSQSLQRVPSVGGGCDGDGLAGESVCLVCADSTMLRIYNSYGRDFLYQAYGNTLMTNEITVANFRIPYFCA